MVDESFGPERRVKSRQDFLRIQSTGKKVRTKHLLLIHAPVRTSNGHVPDSRIGITVTKKVNKNAVSRNRFKRRVREFFRRNHATLNPSTEVVVIALSGATELEGDALNRELMGLFRRARLVQGKQSTGSGTRNFG